MPISRRTSSKRKNGACRLAVTKVRIPPVRSSWILLLYYYSGVKRTYNTSAPPFGVNYILMSQCKWWDVCWRGCKRNRMNAGSTRFSAISREYVLALFILLLIIFPRFSATILILRKISLHDFPKSCIKKKNSFVERFKIIVKIIM